MTAAVVPLVLIGNGVAAGVMLSTVVGITPLTAVLSYDRYVETIKFLWRRYDPMMPITNAATFLLDGWLAVSLREQAAGASFGAAALLLATVMVISVVKNVPINKYVTGLDPARPPDDWASADPRDRWRRWNTTRTLLAFAALAANVLGAANLL
ncbi:MAG TPA: DUF1772 domain-containing protein [Micromonosporaceae bacterium]